MDRSPIWVIGGDVGQQRSLISIAERAGYECRAIGSIFQVEPGCGFHDLCTSRQYVCAVVDVRGLDTTAVSRTRRAIESLPAFSFIVVTAHGDVTSAVWAMRLGATDVLAEPFGDAELAAAIDAAVLRSRRTRQLAQAQQAIRDRLKSLTARELEMLKLVSHGLSNKQIALKLCISQRTVANHRVHILAKTRCANTAELVHVATRAGLT